MPCEPYFFLLRANTQNIFFFLSVQLSLLKMNDYRFLLILTVTVTVIVSVTVT